MGRSQVKPPGRRASYTLSLDREVVCRLRERAARETLAAGRSVTWVDLLREAAKVAAEGGAR